MVEQTRILIGHYLPDSVSGAERSIADMVECLNPVYKVTMLTPGDGKLSNFYHHRHLDVWAKLIHTPRKILPGLHLIQSMFFSRELRQRRFDIVIGNTFSAASRVRTAAHFARIPFCLYVREFIKDRVLHRRILNQADIVFTISKDMKKHLDQMTDPRKVKLVYNYINPNPIEERVTTHREQGNRILPFPSEYPVIGIIGRITRFKQQHIFIQAIPHVLTEVPQARFVIIGDVDDKDYDTELHKLVNDLALKEKVIFMGHRVDTIEITSELSVSCLTSTREPLGRVILEAHLIGCPVVASNIGGPAEIILDGVTGLLFPPLNPDAAFQLAKQIIQLITNPELKEQLVFNARNQIQSTFASLENVRLLESYLERLINREAFVNNG